MLKLLGDLEPLPAGIVVRTPTPSPKMASAFPAHLEPPYISTISTATYHFLDQESTSLFHSDPYRCCLEDTPIYHIKDLLQNVTMHIVNAINTHPYAVSSLNPQHSSFRRTQQTSHFLGSVQQPASWHSALTLDTRKDVQPRLLSNLSPITYGGSALSPYFDAYNSLASALYLLSNNLVGVSNEPRPAEIFEILFKRVPESVLLALLESELPTVRAAWERLVTLSWNLRHNDGFSLLMRFGLRHRDWILPRGHFYLTLAAGFGCLHIVRDLLGIGCRPERSFRSAGLRTVPQGAIMGAIAARSLDCVKLLLNACDIKQNSKVSAHCLVQIHFNQLTVSIIRSRSNLNDRVVSKALDMLLEKGVSVDVPVPSEIEAVVDVPLRWKPTILERSYSKQRDLFKRLLPYSVIRSSKITRLGILMAAQNGTDDLREYLRTRSAMAAHQQRKFLRLVLYEQFHWNDNSIDTTIIRNLLNLGAFMTVPLTHGRGLSSLLYRAVYCAVKGGWRQDMSELFELLVWKGATVRHSTLGAVVTSKGVEHLEKLADLGANIPRQGALAFIRAARLNNFEAVSWLVHHGLDINAQLCYGRRHSGPISIFAAAMCGKGSFRPISRETSRCEMFEYLISLGAIPCLSPRDPNPRSFLCHFLRNADTDLIQITDLLLKSVASPGEILGTDAALLEACLDRSNIRDDTISSEHLEVFEQLFRRGAPVKPGSALALLILSGGRHELVREVLDAGADIDSYSATTFRPNGAQYTPLQAAAYHGDQDLVALLLSKGADINKPARGSRGMTALQAACAWDPITFEEARSKMNLVKFLIQHGANINTSTCTSDGYFGTTALHIAAMRGDIEIAILLLSHGAQVNALCRRNWSHTRYICTALDEAADFGRMDMVKFLLNAGALSVCLGTSGYKSAILSAQNHGHHAIVDLIRKHAADDIRLFGVNPYLQNRREDEKHDCTEACFRRFEGLHEYDEDGTGLQTPVASGPEGPTECQVEDENSSSDEDDTNGEDEGETEEE